MNALPVGISNLLVGRPDTQVTAMVYSFPAGGHNSGEAPSHAAPAAPKISGSTPEQRGGPDGGHGSRPGGVCLRGRSFPMAGQAWPGGGEDRGRRGIESLKILEVALTERPKHFDN